MAITTTQDFTGGALGDTKAIHVSGTTGLNIGDTVFIDDGIRHGSYLIESGVGFGSTIIHVICLAHPGDATSGQTITNPATVTVTVMAKTLAQLINPAQALISPFMAVHGLSYPDQLALVVIGKVYALKAAGGTDYTTNHLQLFIDSGAAEMGETDDELMATRVNVWLQAMGGSATPTITASGTPPVNASQALALVKLTRTRTVESLLRAEVYLDAKLVLQIFVPQ